MAFTSDFLVGLATSNQNSFLNFSYLLPRSIYQCRKFVGMNNFANENVFIDGFFGSPDSSFIWLFCRRVEALLRVG